MALEVMAERWAYHIPCHTLARLAPLDAAPVSLRAASTFPTRDAQILLSRPPIGAGRISEPPTQGPQHSKAAEPGIARLTTRTLSRHRGALRKWLATINLVSH